MAEKEIEIPGEPPPRPDVRIEVKYIDNVKVVKYSKHPTSRAVLWIPGGGWENSVEKSDRSICSLFACLGIDVFTAWPLSKWPRKIKSYLRVLKWIQKSYKNFVIGGVSSGAHETWSIIVKSYKWLQPHGLLLVAPVTYIDNSARWRSKSEPTIEGVLGPEKLQKYIQATFTNPNSKNPTVNPCYTLPSKLGRTPVVVIIFSNDILLEDAYRLFKECEGQGGDIKIIQHQGEHHALRIDANARRSATEAINSLFSHSQQSVNATMTTIQPKLSYSDLPPHDQVPQSDSFQAIVQSRSSSTDGVAGSIKDLEEEIRENHIQA